ncbi:MAG: phosphoribosyl-AMP cyclohydrolase [Candidatus Omnitrophica bacterium]|nr:phosphoribosyl-AMP cyclohydrolase [Candidatus Omnitrophota bacterium]
MKKTLFKLASLKFDQNGLIPAIIQDYKDKEVLMLAYMNKESLRRTFALGKTCFWSRSRKEYWVKGATSGHFQFVKSVAYDCDLDALLIKVRQVGKACHTGNRSCFYRRIK